MNFPTLDSLHHRPVVGLDIGSRSVKCLRWDRGKGRAVACLYPGNLRSGEEKETAEFREFVRANGLAGAAAACSVDDESLKVKKMELPKMPDYDMKEAVTWQMRDVLEGPVSDYVIRYLILEEHSSEEGKKLSVLGFAMKASDVRDLAQFLRKCSLHPMIMEPASVSLTAAFDELQGCQKGQHYGVIDLGESKSVFAAVGDEKLLFTRTLTGATGQELRALLQKELTITESEAAALSRLFVGEGESRADIDSLRDSLRERAGTLLSGHYTRVAVEIQRSIDAFALTFRREKIDQLFLCGGGATLKRLTEHLTTNLAIPTTVLDPSARGVEARSPHLYNIAYGLSRYPV